VSFKTFSNSYCNKARDTPSEVQTSTPTADPESGQPIHSVVATTDKDSPPNYATSPATSRFVDMFSPAGSITNLTPRPDSRRVSRSLYEADDNVDMFNYPNMHRHASNTASDASGWDHFFTRLENRVRQRAAGDAIVSGLSVDDHPIMHEIPSLPIARPRMLLASTLSDDEGSPEPPVAAWSVRSSAHFDSPRSEI
jgi:hypothetical protein